MNKAKKPLITKLGSEEMLKILSSIIIDRIIEEKEKGTLFSNIKLNR